MHYRMFFSSDIWLTAADLFVESTGKTREVTFTIAKVVKGHLVGVGGKRSTKPALHWEEKAKDGSDIKPLAVGAKCCAQIAQATGSTSMNDWPGKKITLYVDQDKVARLYAEDRITEHPSQSVCTEPTTRGTGQRAGCRRSARDRRARKVGGCR